MEKASEVWRLIRYIYYLDENDYVYMSEALTRSVNWMFPAVMGSWMFKRLYLIEKPNLATRARVIISLFPLVSPLISWNIMYFFYYRNDNTVQELLKKYPHGTDFHARKKINPFKIGKRNQK